MPRSQKNVLVTGASGGLGQAVVRRLDGLGWRVFAGVRSPAAGERLVVGSRNVHPVALDVCEQDSIGAARDEIADRVGAEGLTALVNNAGISVDGPLELVPVDRLRLQFEVNVVGQLAVTQAFLPLLRSAGGRVVNVGGAAGRLTLPMFGALSASKAALDTVSDALRMELKHQGVAVSYVEPSALTTELFEKSARTVQRHGFRGSKQAQALYVDALNRSAEAMSKQTPTPVDKAAAVVARALAVRHPKARYLVGQPTRLVFPLLRALPAGARDRVVMAGLGLSAGSFASPANEPRTVNR